MSKTNRKAGHGSLASGAVTAVALAVQTGLAALVGVIIAREFGRSAETDGFFAAYAVFVTLALAATAIRVTVLPRFARARDERRLSGEVAAYARALAVVVVPVLVVGTLAAEPVAALLTGFGPTEARDTAAAVLPWMLLAAAGQLAAGVLASAFAALDEYVVPAVGFIAGSALGLLFILWRLDGGGIEVVAWGVALNAAVAASLPAVVLALRARRERMPRTAVGVSQGRAWRRLGELACGTAVPFALQAIYLICLPIASRDGVGAVTSFGYAFLIGSAVVSVTASSLGLVTSVPLARAGIEPRAIARHVVASSWVALVAIGVTAGVFWLAGESVVSRLLGGGYGADVGTELGEVVVGLTPWMVASVGVSVTFPLVFVARRVRRLPLVAVATLAVHLPLALAGQALWGLVGLALALAASTTVAFVLLLDLLHAMRPTLAGLAGPIATTAALTLAAFVPPALLLDGAAEAAAIGAVLLGGLVALIRPRGLVDAWHYLRALA